MPLWALTQDGLLGEDTQAGKQPPPSTDTQWRHLGNAIALCFKKRRYLCRCFSVVLRAVGVYPLMFHSFDCWVGLIYEKFFMFRSFVCSFIRLQSSIQTPTTAASTCLI